jgi:hypothetical protein
MLIFPITNALSLTNSSLHPSEANTTFIFEGEFSFSSIQVNPTSIELDGNGISVNASSGDLNITILDLTTSYKRFNETASNSSAESYHNIGNFAPSRSIVIKKDGVNWDEVTSDSLGYLTFTYDGGYSSVILEMEQGDLPSISPSGSGGTITRKFYVSGKQLHQGYEKEMGENWILEFELKDGYHILIINYIKRDFVTITIKSEQITFNLILNETKKIDIDGDGYFDISVYLKSLMYNRVRIIVTSINEKISNKSYEGEKKIESNVPQDENYPEIPLEETRDWRVISFVMLIIGVFIILVKESWKRKGNSQNLNKH